MNHLFETLDQCQLHHSSQYGSEELFIEVMGMIARNSGLVANDQIKDFEDCCQARYRSQNYSFHFSEDGHCFIGQSVG